ncbi:unnamed protein product [Chondrus crispus]|uniref:Uncharacterized protein n=1 Tax=Chondrus crispus TaxID=2769 RepID=R7Q850_CHOCR|nr:unnamed protein product [Chondrus crispus]CDF33660.1 unnamed protein product [Chondrus crispus]|eukprot:XP_005713479.1 unnamed protein product [Chondrus crispus]
MKFILFLAIVGLALTSVFAEDIPTEARSRSYRPCPCKCLVGRGARRAIRACRSYRFRFHCEVSTCYYHGKPGTQCCDKDEPRPSASPSSTPSATPSPSPSKSPEPPKCPCTCGSKRDARRECPYKPYCQIMKCPPPEVHHPVPHHYNKPKPEFKCCYKSHVAPVH